MGGHRFAPPVLDPGLVIRDRLITAVAGRWDADLVAVVAGAGFGKSTLLAQAAASNLLAPRGEDRWLRCEPADSVPSHLALGLAGAVGLSPDAGPIDPDDLLDRTFDHIESTWPLGVSLVLDDAHVIDGASRDLLRRVVREAPPCLHLVIASRQPVPGIGRVRSHGTVRIIGEAELRLTAAELDELRTQRGSTDADLADADGWPALADLLARHGGAADDAFRAAAAVLRPEVRRSWAEVVAAGGGPPGAVLAAQGQPIPVRDLVAGLPMVDVHPDGSVVPHQLWERILDEVLTDEEARAARSRVAAWLVGEGDLDRAAPLAAAAGDWPTFRDVIARACSRGYAGPARDVLAFWLTLLPDALRDEPEGLLLRGVSGRADEPFSTATRDLLERAMTGFRDRGEVAGEVAATSEYVYVCRARGEPERLLPVTLRLVELDGEGRHEVDGPVRLARALLAEATGDDEGFLAELDAVPPGALSAEWMAVVEYLRAQVLLNLGRLEAAVAAAARSLEHGGPGYLGGVYVDALMRWYKGDPERALALPTADAHLDGTPIDRFYTGTYGAMVDAFAGRTERAHLSLDVARRNAHAQAKPEMAGELAGASAALAVAEGDEDAARSVLRAHVDAWPVDQPAGRRPLMRFLALGHVLLPDQRDALGALAPAGHHRTTIALAEAFEQARAGDGPDHRDLQVGELTADQVTARLPLRWAAELAARWHDDGRLEGRELAAGLGARHGSRLRDALRAHAEDGTPGAKALLRLVAVDGGATAEVDVLGPTNLVVDGNPAAGGEWGRRAVRMVLSHLVIHPHTSRDEVLAAVWPDLDQSRAEANLRTTLSHLHRLLEPGRAPGEASYLIRVERRELTLARAPHLAIDVDAFEALIDEGELAHRRSAPSQALLSYEAALGLWRGEPYQDLPDDPWVEAERDRLRARFVGASVRTAEIHLARGDGDRAVARAGDALLVEPWSEPAYRVLIAAHIARGDHGSARRALERCRAMLVELGTGPAAETQMVARLLDE